MALAETCVFKTTFKHHGSYSATTTCQVNSVAVFHLNTKRPVTSLVLKHFEKRKKNILPVPV